MRNSHISLLSEYIQIDTTASAGNEEKGLLFMKSLAEKNGLFTLFLPTGYQKGNLLIALCEEDLLPFTEDQAAPFHEWTEPPIVLLSHVDVVSANAEDWEYPPFSGTIANGEIWGRGAIDAKQIGMTHLMAMINLKDTPLRYPVIQLITCEEETGSEKGLKEFLRQFPSLWENALVLNEGGGFPIEIRGKYFYLIETGQKGNASFTITTSSGNNKNPYLPSNESALNALKIAEKLHTFQLPGEQLSPSVHKMFASIAKESGIQNVSSEWQSVLSEFPLKYQRFFSALTKSTLTVTSFQGGKNRNELEGTYRLTVDARPLPHTNLNLFQEAVEQLISQYDAHATVEWHIPSQGYDQEIEETLCWLIEQALLNEQANILVVPFMTIGSNDGRYFQQAGAKVIGYCPMLPEMTFDKVLHLVHGVDERIAVKDFEFGIRQLTAILEQVNELSILRR